MTTRLIARSAYDRHNTPLGVVVVGDDGRVQGYEPASGEPERFEQAVETGMMIDELMQRDRLYTFLPEYSGNEGEVTKRDFSAEQRREYAKKGVALPDGSYPIPDKDALRRAIQSFGRGNTGKEAVKAHIIKRARALGATDMLPEDWVVKEAVEHVSGDIVKTDPDRQLVFGWAYVTHDPSGNLNIDKSGDFADDIEEIEKSAYDFVLRSRQGDADHTNVAGSTLVESIVFTPEKVEKMGLPEDSVPLGWWVGFHVDDDPTWQRVKKGELRAFSIHGKGVRSKVEE